MKTSEGSKRIPDPRERIKAEPGRFIDEARTHLKYLSVGILTVGVLVAIGYFCYSFPLVPAGLVVVMFLYALGYTMSTPSSGGGYD